MTQNTLLRLEGVTCEHCGERLERTLRSIPGVEGVQMNWRESQCRVGHRETVAAKDLMSAVEAAAVGTEHRYGAIPVGEGQEASPQGGARRVLPFLMLGLFCLPCAAAAIGFASVAAFLFSSRWTGTVPALVLAAFVAPGAWWLLRRRQKSCSTCLKAGN